MPATDPATSTLPANMRRASILSSLWIFVLLSILVRDVHEIVTREFLEEAMNRRVSDELLLVAGIIPAMPIAMVPLSKLLPRVWSRRANLLVLPIIAVGTITNPPGDLDDYWFAALGVLGLVSIAWFSWTWRPGERKTGPHPTAPAMPSWESPG